MKKSYAKDRVLYAVAEVRRKYFTIKKGLKWVAGLADTYHCDEALLLVLLTRLQKEIFDE